MERHSLKQIIKLLSARKISVKELVKYYYSRIEKYNPTLNAVVSLRNIDQVDEDLDGLKQSPSGKKRKLLGIPLAIKDLIDVAGLPTTYGVPRYKNNVAKKNSLIVERLIDNGAVIIGKTNTPEWGLGSQTFNRLFGTTANPYDTRKTPGGSSGGAAAAIAADLIPIADGSDMMGSCRNPAAYCNLYGFRPTPGLIPEERSKTRHKKLPLLSTLGMLAKDPEDLAYSLDIVSGAHRSDPFSFDLNSSFDETNICDNIMRKIKIGWLDNFDGYYQVDEEIRNQCKKTLTVLDQNSVVVEEIKPTANPHYLSESWKMLRSKSLYDELVNYNLSANEKILSVDWEIRNGQVIEEENIDEALLWRSLWDKDINSIFKKYDFLALPSTQVHPFNKDIPSPTAINGEPMGTYHQWMDIVVLASILGLPTLSVPVGFSREGLPIGMQIIGKRKSDINLIAFAKKYETMFNYSKIIPKEFN
tara:strand:- start:387 stop:1805 length:1419 start_codon:yes stop_codon:yes gene_type:complete